MPNNRCRSRIDLKGETFGNYYVESEAKSITDGGKPSRVWNCTCRCGNKRIVRQGALRNGSSKSCGCLFSELVSKANKKHGMYEHYLYKAWTSMIQRCSNPNNPSYKNYGGRGIFVCDRWTKFPNFLEDVGDRPNGLTLDRRDNDDGYYPENCRWATSTLQSINKRRRANNPTGVTGVIVRGGSWSALIQVGGEKLWLGSYDNIFDAACARISKENKLFGGLV